MADQVKQISIGGGIDTKTDPKRVEMPNMLDLNNLVFTRRGSYRTRFGSIRLSTATNDTPDVGTEGRSAYLIGEPKGLAVRDDELIMFDDNYAYVYGGATSSWLRLGQHSSSKVEEETLLANEENQFSVDTAVNGRTRLTAWQEADGVHFACTDETSGSLYFSSSVASAEGPKCLSVGGALHLYYHDGAGALTVKAFSASFPLLSTITTLEITDELHSDLLYDVCSDVSTNTAMVVYKWDNGGTNVVRTYPISADGSASGIYSTDPTTCTVLSGPLADCNCLTIFSAPGNIFYVAYAEATYTIVSKSSTKIQSWGVVLIPEATCDSIAGAANPNDATEYRVVTCTEDATDPFVDAAAELTNTGSTLHFGLAAKPFWHKDSFYCPVYRQTPLQSTYYLVTNRLAPDGTDTGFYVCGMHSPGYAEGRPYDKHYLPAVQAVGNKFYWAGVYRARFDVRPTDNTGEPNNSDRGDFYAAKSPRLISYDFGAPGRYNSVQFGKTTYISGSHLAQYDGASLHEAGFFFYPEASDANQYVESTLGTGTTPVAADYHYKQRFGHVNNVDERARSGCIGSTYTHTDAKNVQIVPGISAVTNRPAVWDEYYRSEGDPSLLSALELHRVTSPNPDDTGANGWLNTGDTLTDSMTDANLILKELDYGNVEENNWTPGAANIMVAGNGRIWLAGLSEDPYSIRYSKRWRPGLQAEFCQKYIITMSPEGGPITGLGVINELLIVFCKDRIYVISGSGPDQFRVSQGGFTEPQQVSSDVGCVSFQSMVRTPQGIMFQSDKGFYELDQSLRVKYVGAAVEAYNDVNVTAAVLMNDQNQVRFLTADRGTLVYDYYAQQWTIFTIRGVAAVAWKEKFVYIDHKGQINVETEGEFLDAGATINSALQTPWISFTNRQGWQIVRLLSILGSWKSAHTIKVTAYFDYDLQRSVETTWTPDGVINTSQYGGSTYGDGDSYGGGATTTTEWANILLGRRRCSVVSFRIEIQSNGSGEAFELSDLLIKGKVKKGPARLPSKMRAGAS